MPPRGSHAPWLATSWLVIRKTDRVDLGTGMKLIPVRAHGCGGAVYGQMHCPISFLSREASPRGPTLAFLLNSYSSYALFYWFRNLVILWLIFLTCCSCMSFTKTVVNIRANKVLFIILLCYILVDIIICSTKYLLAFYYK